MENQEEIELEKACLNLEEEGSEFQLIKKELDEQKDKFLRLAAEYENFRKRTNSEKKAIYLDATSLAILNILPVVDSLDAAFRIFETLDDQQKKGFEMIQNQMKITLERLKVETFGKVGDDFVPELHDAVLHTDDEENENKNFISEVLKKGYKIGDRIIRHAVVQVTN